MLLDCRGGMIFTFYKARGMSVGSSLVEEDKLDLAKRLEEAAKAKGVEFILPTDVIAADKFDENANTKVVAAGEIPDGWMVSPLKWKCVTVCRLWNLQMDLSQDVLISKDGFCCPDTSKAVYNVHAFLGCKCC